MKPAVLKIPASIFLEIAEIIFQSSYFLEYRKILFIQLPVYKPPEYTNIWPQVYNPINIPNISPPTLPLPYIRPLEYRPNLSSLLNIKFIKSISMYFASAIYLASFFTNESFIEIDSSRHKASDQQATTQARNYLIKVNNKNTVTRSGKSLNLTIRKPERPQRSLLY